MRRVALIIVVLAALSHPAAVRADTASGDAAPRPGGALEDGSPSAVVVRGPAGELGSYRRSGRRSTSGPRWTCSYQTATPNDFGLASYDPTEAPVQPEPGGIYVLVCLDEHGNPVSGRFARYDPADPLGGVLAAERAAAIARERLPLPDPDLHTSPPADTAHLVGVPTWYWITDPWTPRQASATLGGVTATVTAAPTRLHLDTGDGHQLSCDDAGTPWQPDTTSTCTHTYQRSSRHTPTGRYPLTATVTWTTTWTATTGETGDLEPLTRTTTLELHIQEAQATIN